MVHRLSALDGIGRASAWAVDQCGRPLATALAWASLAWLTYLYCRGDVAFSTYAISCPPYIIGFMILAKQRIDAIKAEEREAAAQRRDVAMHAKLDEILRADPQADNALIGVENRADEIEVWR